MKKKFIAIILFIFTTISLIGCGNTNSGMDSKETTKQEVADINPNEKTVDGVKFTLSNVSREDVKGDRTQDNISDDNGEYFAIGSKTVKTSDYEYIVVKFKIENTTDKAIALSKYGWTATMKDGYKLKGITLNDDLKGQIASNNYIDGIVTVLAEKKLNVNQFDLKYNLIDYTNFDKMVSDAISGKSEAECKTKYPELFKENYATFNIEVK